MNWSTSMPTINIKNLSKIYAKKGLIRMRQNDEDPTGSRSATDEGVTKCSHPLVVEAHF
jgi:hypothetical protein